MQKIAANNYKAC